MTTSIAAIGQHQQQPSQLPRLARPQRARHIATAKPATARIGDGPAVGQHHPHQLHDGAVGIELALARRKARVRPEPELDQPIRAPRPTAQHPPERVQRVSKESRNRPRATSPPEKPKSGIWLCNRDFSPSDVTM